MVLGILSKRAPETWVRADVIIVERVSFSHSRLHGNQRAGWIEVAMRYHAMRCKTDECC